MRNLAGVEDCDIHIRKELEKAGIMPLTLRELGRSEVPYTVFGCLGAKPLSDEEQRYFDRMGTTPEFARTMGSFVFVRAWYYWCVSGFVPLVVAEEMYEERKEDVRSGGDCACRPPATWKTRHKFCGMDVVNSYHIDTQEGLNYFVQTMKKHSLI